MAEHVISAIVGELASAVASSVIGNKIDELTGVLDKIKRLEWRLLKIESAIEESKKCDIYNGPLVEWRQKFIDAAKEANDVLQDFKNRSTVSDPQSTGQGVTVIGPPVHSLADNVLIRTYILTSYLKDLFRVFSLPNPIILFIKRISKIEKLHRTLEKLEMMSNDVGDFLEMLRHQKRKRDRRRRYRPYKHFFEFTYLELVQDALGYCRAHVWWMQLLLLETGTVRESGSKAAAASTSVTPKVWLDVVSLSHKSLLLV